MTRSHLLAVLTALVSITSCQLYAAPYSTNVLVSGTSVSFILNEPADTLLYRVNSGVWQPLDGSSKGTKSFSLGAATDTFSIVAGKNDPLGYTIPTGGAPVVASANGLSQTTNPGGVNIISDDANLLTRFNSPRGVSVSTNPNAPKFGTTYVSNSAAGATAGRNLGDGLYAVHADQSDAFGYGDTAQDPGNLFDGVAASASSPFRVTVAPNGEVYVADFSDANGNVYRLNSNMTSGAVVLQGIGGPGTLPAGQNHGSTTSVHVEGSSATGDLILYTVDEDLRSSQFGGPVGDDRNSLWRYNINAGALPSNVTPTKVNTTNVLLPAATSDMQRGTDGKFYLAQNRSAGNEAGVVVLDANGVKLYDSLTDSRALLGNPAAVDILRNVQGMAVSTDQTWLAVMLNNSDVAVVPLVNGLPDLANRLIVDSANPDVNSGRDIAFDAAGNIHLVSSGTARYRVLSPGGVTYARTDFDGTNYSFAIGSTAIPEPSAMVLAGLALLGLAGLARRR
ncbi:MAG: PEP-CTERM sorting domain-containing protein [Pirellulales bacterium]